MRDPKNKNPQNQSNQFILNMKKSSRFPVCSTPHSENFSDSILMEFNTSLELDSVNLSGKTYQINIEKDIIKY